MTAKEWLQRGWKLDKEINALLSLRAEARRRALSISPSYKGDVVQSSANPHKFDKLVELESAIDARVDELTGIRAEIIAAIAQVPDARYRTLLIERYTEFKTWEQIAVDIGYSWRGVMMLHGKALDAIAAIIEKCS